MINFVIKKVFGSQNERYLKTLRPLIAEINALEPNVQKMQDEDLPARIAELKAEVANGTELKEILPEVFAIVREASVRILGMRHYDVQLIGGCALHDGKIAEMKTGEGKTLVATLPVVLNALTGKGVHVITVNDYLASRDAEWMGKLYSFLGLTTGIIVHGLNDEERKAAYGSDITYGTNNEFGFDYLRDNMKFYKEQLVQRPHNYAIVDEVDSILIDEARTPLIISGASEDSTALYGQIDTIVPFLTNDVHYTMDEKARSASLTDEGVVRVEELLKVDNLYDPTNITLQHHVLQALKAHKIFKRDVDYIVKDDQVVIVDEFTGRLMPGRRFSDGLHQALEAKEGVKVEAENQTLASITFQNYFRMYEKLSGMTGTADTEAVEFQQIYNLSVCSIPSNRPLTRKDFPDVIYRTNREKFNAIADSIAELHKADQPVLVGTISIETSELISQLLKQRRTPHSVLNAKHHEQEAEIIAEAGQKGRVTIATNMAGRGTDIVLGEGVTEAGGLHILGTERHESRRIDNQLRGRSGRQGDPGSSRFYLSLEDDLMRLFASERMSGMMQKLGMDEGEPIENSMVSKAIENAQKRVEGRNFEIRKTLLDYDDVMNQQREVIYTLRRDIMMNESQEELIQEFLGDLMDALYEQWNATKPEDRKELAESLPAQLDEVFNLSASINLKPVPSEEETHKAVQDRLAVLKDDAKEVYEDVLRYFLLEELDRCWKEHLLTMDHLREGIGLRGYGQRDPKQEYKREGFELFQDMLFRIRENVFKALTRLRIQRPEEEEQEILRDEFRHKEETDVTYSGSEDEHKPSKRTEPKIGRNAPCPCGSGKKYKKCCGA
ncbi:preprotein translocase subunit SecA [Halodesulfovibrio sp. MK-HDV]|jgi:preprotein translocase subunit SecA|uniref:preprotein translocase subunit SecA n=1 Tax=Halodesulfovibrio sp. MK-HDV TaxID=2599925 RepID=UPI0013685E3A|nr:preprotein translocase subunit SecA [Halodesulfovibrio sp. MK-HDV]KAF1075300.1 Protein translocase subunit SecA [Halodesulfovibrio sp. MK-HDV]